MIIDTFQTFGDSHKKLLENLIKDGKKVLLCITESEDSDITASDIELNLKRQLWRLMGDEKLKIIIIPKIESINLFGENGESLIQCEVGK